MYQSMEGMRITIPDPTSFENNHMNLEPNASLNLTWDAKMVGIGISASVGLFSAFILKASAQLFTTDAQATG